MSETALHELPAAGPLTGAEIVPVDDGTATVRTTVAAIRSGLAVQGHGHTPADVAGLQPALDAKAPLAVPAGSRLKIGMSAAIAAGPHRPENVGAVALTVMDGGGDSGVFVENIHDGTYSSQQVVFRTAQGGISATTPRLRIAPDGSLQHRDDATTIVDAASHLGLRSYTVATIPTASPAGRLAFVSDGSSNRRLAVADGTAWRWPDGSAVS
ncbi:hypothetical protein [Azospirillum thermophilum]|uniref:Uncharacterized protein n=1 Tax=Azospirillum thermophilum TaxID=2202148 RepID=A0A2S2D087_9PROT|nr:hypothetical protein [Azospirillum thermophilum]AWK90166.1 hypothetical protein DEW08_29575 [Azospirillum thermophilum]